LAAEFNDTIKKGKEWRFDYTAELVDIKDRSGGDQGAILLYPDMLRKRLVASVDLLMIVPLIFKAGDEGAAMAIDPDTGDKDIFQRTGPDDNKYFDAVTSLAFNVVIKNAGLNAGQLFLENKITANQRKYKLLIVDLAKPDNNLSLDGNGLEDIRGIWPFIPQASIVLEPRDELRIRRSFNIDLQSVTVKVGGEYTFETGL
jgi:hypothetical protein